MNKRQLKKALKRIKYLPKNKYLLLYVINKFRALWLKLIKSTKVAYPSTIMLELTNHCNLACTTCPREYEYGKHMDKGSIDLDQAKKIIDELWPYLDSVGLTGMGETFLFKEIEEIVDYIKSKNKGIIISVSTNAVIPKFIEKVSGLINKIDTIQISIDGLDHIYESIRKNANFELLDQNLTQLSELSKGSETTLMLNMVVTKENYKHIPLLVEYTDKIEVEYLDFTLLNLASLTNEDRSYYDFYKSDEFLDTLSELENKIVKHKSVTVTNRNFKTDNSFQKCLFPWTHFYICWDGFMPPCCAKPFPRELNFGNVFKYSVMDVLNSSDYREFRELWFENKSPKFCTNCHLIDIEPIKV